ncbi:hypothetical protein A8E62_12135 [Burkholderia cenocepacia]|uniref:Uncharacterized protein n=2 Tax=Burkholderiaceae TaxID=119060 RepID=A0AAJ5T8Z9_9BURK|nr:hypothetical protein A8E62_12135 [Burkholderia cenocepacia]ONU92827.1 hypothetical protein A8E63_08620 [Burkholderia cenocepacia]VBB17417.1 hypothetical protein BSTAB16_7633 [Burkholderia stabilis]
MRRDSIEQENNKAYFPLITAQYPGLLDEMTNPTVQVMSIHLNDLDLAIGSLEREWTRQGCENVQDERERAGQIFDELRDVPGIPLPPGAMLLVIAHGADDKREHVCVPIRTDGPKSHRRAGGK